MTAHEIIHPSRPRVYVRKFDHEEAALRHGMGEPIAALAREYGVTHWAVASAIRRLDPAEREADNQRLRDARTTVCEVCGGPAMALVGGKAGHNRDGRVLCTRCRSHAMREGVRVDADGRVLEVLCFECREWKAPAAFSSGKRYRDLRENGFHSQCRPCNTVARRAYRERNKVPCEGCGKPVEGKGRANTNAGPTGRRAIDPHRPFLCPVCWHESPEGQAAHQASIEASRLARKKT